MLKELAERDAAREARVLPALGDHRAMVEYLLATADAEMDFEIVRCRPHLVRRRAPLGSDRAPHLHAWRRRRPPTLRRGRRAAPRSRRRSS